MKTVEIPDELWNRIQDTMEAKNIDSFPALLSNLLDGEIYIDEELDALLEEASNGTFTPVDDAFWIGLRREAMGE